MCMNLLLVEGSPSCSCWGKWKLIACKVKLSSRKLSPLKRRITRRLRYWRYECWSIKIDWELITRREEGYEIREVAGCKKCKNKLNLKLIYRLVITFRLRRKRNLRVTKTTTTTMIKTSKTNNNQSNCILNNQKMRKEEELNNRNKLQVKCPEQETYSIICFLSILRKQSPVLNLKRIMYLITLFNHSL